MAWLGWSPRPVCRLLSEMSCRWIGNLWALSSISCDTIRCAGAGFGGRRVDCRRPGEEVASVLGALEEDVVPASRLQVVAKLQPARPAADDAVLVVRLQIQGRGRLHCRQKQPKDGRVHAVPEPVGSSVVGAAALGLPRQLGRRRGPAPSGRAWFLNYSLLCQLAARRKVRILLLIVRVKRAGFVFIRKLIRIRGV